jgi:hypothetical protein
MKSFFLLYCCGNLIFTSAALAQTQRALDAARMQRDVEIMEMVLERLLNENTTPFVRLGGHSARGVYLPDFGVLFRVPQALSSFSYFEFHADDEGEVTGNSAQPAVSAQGLITPEGETSASLESELVEFFSRYADAIGQLGDHDRIAVYRGTGPEFSIFFNFPGLAGKQVRSSQAEMLAWVRKSDLEDLQTGKLEAATFKSRVSFTRSGKGPAIPINREEIKMLADIFEDALGLPHGEANGIYLDHYGAVLFASADFNHSLPRPVWGWSTGAQGVAASEGSSTTTVQTIEDYVRAAERASRERAQGWQNEYEKFKETLVATIANHGHMLRHLRADERLVVVTDLSNVPEKQPHQLVCAVKQHQIEAYHTRRISLEQLRQAITLYEN